MENYNFQIANPGTDWEDVEHKTIAFPSRKEAVTFAHNLSYMVNREIRMTQGNPMKESGTYIRM